jgi:tetratricopeptide (TPR) repeat protein
MMKTTLPTSPDSAEPRNSLALSLSLLERDPGNISLRARCIQAALRAKDPGQASQLLREVPPSAAADPQIRYAQAHVLMAQKDMGGAAASLESLMSTGTDNAGVRISLATCYYLLNRHPEVITTIRPLQEAGQLDAGGVRLLVSSLHHVGEIDQAVALAGQSSSAAEVDGPTAGVFALLYLDADDAANAARWAGVALSFNPDSIDGLITQGTLDAAELKSDLASSQFRRVLELAPDNPRAWIGLGSLSLVAERFDEARQCFEKGLESLPEHLGSWLVLGWNHLLSGDLPAAERTFLHALELDRTFGETHGALASVAALRGNHDEATQLAEVALRLDPECLSAQFAQAVVTGARGDPQAAQRKILRTAARLGIRRPEQDAQTGQRPTRH